MERGAAAKPAHEAASPPAAPEPAHPMPEVHRPGPSAFRKAVEAEKHVFDFASFVFRITAWWSAFALLVHSLVNTHVDIRAGDAFPLDVTIDISIPATILTGIGLAVFAGYGLYMVSRVWVILTKVRDARFPRERHGRATRFVLTFLAFCAVNIAILLAVVLVVNTLQKL